MSDGGISTRKPPNPSHTSPDLVTTPQGERERERFFFCEKGKSSVCESFFSFLPKEGCRQERLLMVA